MVKLKISDRECSVIKKHIRVLAFCHVFDVKPSATFQFGRENFLGEDLVDDNRQTKILTDIPGISLKFSGNIVRDSRRTINVKCFGFGQVQAEQSVKADKVIDMRMGDEQITDFSEAGVSKIIETTIEEYSPLSINEIDI